MDVVLYVRAKNITTSMTVELKHRIKSKAMEAAILATTIQCTIIEFKTGFTPIKI